MLATPAEAGQRCPIGARALQKKTAPVVDAPPCTVVVLWPEPDLTFPEFPWLLMLYEGWWWVVVYWKRSGVGNVNSKGYIGLGDDSDI